MLNKEGDMFAKAEQYQNCLLTSFAQHVNVIHLTAQHSITHHQC